VNEVKVRSDKKKYISHSAIGLGVDKEGNNYIKKKNLRHCAKEQINCCGLLDVWNAGVERINQAARNGCGRGGTA